MSAGPGSLRSLVVFGALMLMPGLARPAPRPGAFAAAFSFDCAETIPLPAAIHDFLEVRVERQGRLGVATWLDRAVLWDLNGDDVRDFFVPYDCGATGSCLWGLFDGVTQSHLGDLEATVFFPSLRRKKGWPSVEVYLQSGQTQGLVATYDCHRGRYARGGWDMLTDPTGKGPIRRYLSARPPVGCGAGRRSRP